MASEQFAGVDTDGEIGGGETAKGLHLAGFHAEQELVEQAGEESDSAHGGGVLVDAGGGETLVPIHVRTRRIQLVLLGAGLAGSLILRLVRRRRR